MVMAAGVCLSQTAHYITFAIPGSVDSGNILIRYILAGGELGALVQPRSGVSSYLIDTTRGGQSATRIKAVIYAPGCAIQTLDLPLSNSNNPRYAFVCFSLGSVWIAGRVAQTGRLAGREIKLQARYVARWAGPFLGLGAGIRLTIPVGDVAPLSADNSFRISVPDLSRDRLAGAPDRPGELQIWAKDRATGDDIVRLILLGPQTARTRMGDLKIQSEYPPETVFAPCNLPRSLVLIDRSRDDADAVC
jgi:hypothetical protein